MSINYAMAVQDNCVIQGSTKSVLMALAIRADDKGSCYPSIMKVAQDAGLSRSTVKRSLARLQSDSFLSVKNRQASCASSIYQLSLSEIKKCKRDRNNPRAIETPPLGHSEPSLGSPCTKPRVTVSHIKVIEKSIEKSGKEARPPERSPTSTGLPEEKSEVKAKLTGNYSAADVIAETTKHSPEEVVEHYKAKKHSPRMLEFFWRSLLVSTHVDIGTVKKMTQKEVGQLKHLYKAVGEEFHDALHFCMKDWIAFISHCESQHGAFKSPSIPDVGYALKFAQGVLTYHHQQTFKEPVQVIAPWKPPKDKPGPSKPQKEAEVPMTKAELLELEKELFPDG